VKGKARKINGEYCCHPDAWLLQRLRDPHLVTAKLTKATGRAGDLNIICRSRVESVGRELRERASYLS